MTMSDPISDMLTRIRNAQSSNKNSVSIPSSSLKISIAEVLKKEGYIVDFEVSDDQVKKYIVIGLKYHEGVPVIESIERGSRPGLRLYKDKESLPEVLGGLGVAIISTSAGVMSDREAREKGIKVKLSSFKRQVKNSVSNAKVNGNYVHSIVALTEALEDGFDEALMLDTEGFVAEGSGENFFIARNGVLYSPNLDSCLDGITRRTIIDLAEELNIPFKVKQITVQDVLDADESFFSGTAAEVVPINSLDNQFIGAGIRGPITEKLQTTYFDQVRGKRDLNDSWHTYTN